jgi:glucose/arabinose dehydrogenase
MILWAYYLLILVLKKILRDMKRISIAFVTMLISSVCLSQAIYFEPFGSASSAPVRLYIDLFSSECNCPELQDADSETNPIYIWTWSPNEMRPDLNIDGETFNVMNGNWDDSNENLRLTQDDESPDLWYYDFLGVSLEEFYSVSSNNFEDGISFLLKEKSGLAPPDGFEQKSPDLNISVESQSIDDFSIGYEEVLSGISSPTTITHAGDERIFVTEQSGRIRVFYRDGTLESEPFLDIQDRVTSGGERGLLGLAFEPDFCESGRFYVNYTATDDTLVTRISRFTVSDENPLMGDPDSEEILIQFGQDFPNHNGGHVEFGSDGFLYIGTGDGGSGGDPNNRGQDITSYLGKILRIDVSPETDYLIASGNPFEFDDFGLDEIWSYGLRNPWKFAFDRELGNLYIADVGQNAFEEVNFEPFDATGGFNYGWRCYEGDSNFNLSGCSASDYVFPIVDYPHTGAGCTGSVTGGRVYRGLSFEEFQGWYFYTDLCTGNYYAVTQVTGETFQQAFGTIGQSQVTTFGEDVWGEVYFGNGNGIHRLLDPNDELLEPITQVGAVLSSTYDGVSYQWFFDNESVGTGLNLEVDELGLYTLVVTTGNSTCQVESTIDVTSLSTGDYSVSRNPLTIFPNPANESVTIDLEGYTNDAHSLAIYSIDGRLIRSVRVNSNRLGLNLTGYEKGAYILNLLDVSGNSIAQSKLIRN